MKIKNLFPVIIFTLLIIIFLSIFFLMYYEFRLNIAYTTPLDCKAPNFITNSKKGDNSKNKFKDKLKSEYVDKCSGYSTKNTIWNTNTELNEFIHGHWVALKALFSDPDNLKQLIESNRPEFPIINDAASESLWLAIVEIENKCDPKNSPPIKSCTDLIQSMVSNKKLKLYPENRLAYLRDNFSDESDFIQRLTKYTGLALTRETCRTGSFYLEGGSNKKPCTDLENIMYQSQYSFKEDAGQYYPVLTKKE